MVRAEQVVVVQPLAAAQVILDCTQQQVAAVALTGTGVLAHLVALAEVAYNQARAQAQEILPQ